MLKAPVPDVSHSDEIILERIIDKAFRQFLQDRKDKSHAIVIDKS